ncbi:hypothetical protein BDW22DRAFT_1428477 [Trametopsis cervina]|nr:hypothetical protein BDW22DRAFT_1428477 [Trametopsis cervina]
MAWTFPPELDDIILDHLHDDALSLSRCALVQRSWLPTARYHFWNHLRLNCTATELNKLRALLDSSDVGYYVQTVSVLQKKGEACQWYDLNLLHHTLSVLSKLPSMTHLILDGLWFGAPKGAEPTSIVVSPSVRKLTVSTCSFDNFEDVQQLCRAFPSLARVQFDGVWWGRWASELSLERAAELELSARAIALRELDLGSCFSRDRVIEWLLTAVPRDSIETLRLPLVSPQDTRLKELLASVSRSLRHLEIGSPSTCHSAVRAGAGPEQRLESYLDLSKNRSLRSITLGVPTYRDPEFINTWLRSILTQIASSDLEEIRFAVYPILRGDAADAENMLASFGWSDMAKLLDSPRFASVRKVTFTSGRKTDYTQIPGAFVPLTPLLQKVIPRFFDVGWLGRSGINLAFQCI